MPSPTGSEARRQASRRSNARVRHRLDTDPTFYRHFQERRALARMRDKHDAFIAYGGSFCACCGETEFAFLTLDHINNDGGKERRAHGRGIYTYGNLRKRGYPPGLQVLCMNCNFGKSINGGICPHKDTKQT